MRHPATVLAHWRLAAGASRPRGGADRPAGRGASPGRRTGRHIPAGVYFLTWDVEGSRDRRTAVSHRLDGLERPRRTWSHPTGGTLLSGSGPGTALAGP